MNKKKMLALPLIAIMLSLTTAVAVAHWVDNVYVHGYVETGYLEACVYRANGIVGDDWTASPGLKNPHQLTKDIAETNVTWTCDTLTITVNNGYPCFYDDIDFNVLNTGTIPWAVSNITFWSYYGAPVVIDRYGSQYFLLDLNNDTYPDIEFRWGDMAQIGYQVDPGVSVEYSFEFHLLNPIPQGAHCLQFFAQIDIVNWNEYMPPTPPTAPN